MNVKELTNFNVMYDYMMSRFEDDRAAFCFNTKEYTFKDLRSMADHYVRHLKALGIKKGMGVGYTLPNCPELIPLFLAVCRIGAYSIPLFHMIPGPAKASIFKAGRASLVITGATEYESFKNAASTIGAQFNIALIDSNDNGIYSLSAPAPEDRSPSPVEVEPYMPSLLASSSGTTGMPKTVMMNQINLISALKSTMDMVNPADHFGGGSYSSVIAFPLSTSGIIVVCGNLFAGVKIIFSENVSPVKFLELVSSWKADSMAAPPSYYEAILSLPHIDTFNTESVKTVLTGMDFFSPSLMSRLMNKFTNLSSYASGYGLVETATIFMAAKILNKNKLNGPTNKLRLAGDVGNRISIRDENGEEVPDNTKGELWVKGPSVVSEYLGNPEETARAFSNGFFKTGDIAKKEENGTITLLGRNKYTIKRGGKSVSPLVIETCINEVDNVMDSAIVGVPHKLYGQMIWAFVVYQKESAGLEKEIMKFCRKELANYMIPDHIQFVAKIPKNPGVGKVNYEELIRVAKENLKSMEGTQNA